MAFGNNYAERSRKTDLITQIMMSRSPRMDRKAAQDSVAGYRRKTVAELTTLAKEEYKLWNAWKVLHLSM